MQKEFEQIVQEIFIDCFNNLIAINIPIDAENIGGVRFARLRGMVACCKAYRDYNRKSQMIYRVCIDENFEKYIEDPIVLENLKNIMYHELIHTCPDSWEHNENFIKWCKVCDMEYGSDTLTTADRDIIFNKRKTPAYIDICPKCGLKHKHAKKLTCDFYCDTCKVKLVEHKNTPDS